MQKLLLETKKISPVDFIGGKAPELARPEKIQRMNNQKIYIQLVMFLLVIIFGSLLLTIPGKPAADQFNGERAWEDVKYQTDLGPRIPGSQAHAETVDWIQAELELEGWKVEVQEEKMMGHTIFNIVAHLPEKETSDDPWIILGAHYDSRIYADRDPDPERRLDAVPGANDGASGVAVLLELGRVLPKDLSKNIWLVFFDAEDNGNIPGWDWILGSRAFVAKLEGKPDAVVIVDMIGDADLNIYMERNSDEELLEEIWDYANELGNSEQFIPSYKHSILDDHTPFLQAGITAVDLIDFDYSYWHTTADTADKVSADSLQAVGDTLYAWVTESVKGRPVGERAFFINSWIEKLVTLLRRERLR